MTAAPLVSVVIACVNGLPAIRDCLRALAHQDGDVSAELLVACRCGEDTRDVLRREFPTVTLLAAPEGTSIPALRGMCMAQARGRMVAILEDHCNVHPQWLKVVARAHAAGWQAVGGAVRNGSRERAVDWAVFFCEYARFMPPMPKGRVAEITGNNSVYDRAVLDQVGPELTSEVWEGFLHQRLSELAVPFHCDPELLVDHTKEFGFGYFLGQRYHYSRSFAAMRLAGAPLWKRLAFALATPALPPLLFVRITRTVMAKGGHFPELVRALPAMCVFLLSWAWGEGVGALLGPGDSLARVE